MNILQIQQIIRTRLPQLQHAKLKLKLLSSFTNLIYCVFVEEKPQFIFKQFGKGFNRQKQSKIVKLLSEKNLTPKKIFEEETYSLQQFLKQMRHPSLQLIKDRNFLTQAMTNFSKFHSLSYQEKNENNMSQYLFTQIQREKIKEIGLKLKENHEVNLKLSISPPPQTPSGSQTLKNLEKSSILLKLISKIDDILKDSLIWRDQLLRCDKIALCHNDAHCLNILHNQETIYFIDYDYIGNNYIPYDLANFINEFHIEYTNETPGFKLHKKLTLQDISPIVQLYPGYYQGLQIDVLAFLCVCNLFWSIWSLQFGVTKDSGIFDYGSHGLMRVQLFWYYSDLLQKEVKKAHMNASKANN